MTMSLLLQGRSCALDQLSYPEQFTLDNLHGVDLDYGFLTVVLPDQEGDNLRLAVPATMLTEAGHLAPVGWRIDPDPELLLQRRELAPLVGAIYGRPIAWPDEQTVHADRMTQIATQAAALDTHHYTVVLSLGTWVDVDVTLGNFDAHPRDAKVVLGYLYEKLDGCRLYDETAGEWVDL